MEAESSTRRLPPKTYPVVVDQSNHTAHQPASRITSHGDRKDGVGDEVRCDVQIDLTEHHKGKEHDVHRDLTLPAPLKGPA